MENHRDLNVQISPGGNPGYEPHKPKLLNQKHQNLAEKSPMGKKEKSMIFDEIIPHQLTQDDYYKNYDTTKEIINNEFVQHTVLEAKKEEIHLTGAEGSEEDFKNFICMLQNDNDISRKHIEKLYDQYETALIPPEPVEHLEDKIVELAEEISQINRDIKISDKEKEEIESKLASLDSDKLIINTRVHKMKKNALAITNRIQHTEHLKYTIQLSNCQIGYVMHNERVKNLHENELGVKVTEDLKQTKINFEDKQKNIENDVIDTHLQIQIHKDRIEQLKDEKTQIDRGLKESINRLKLFDHIMGNISVLSEMESFLFKLDKLNKDELEEVFLQRDKTLKKNPDCPSALAELTRSDSCKFIHQSAIKLQNPGSTISPSKRRHLFGSTTGSKHLQLPGHGDNENQNEAGNRSSHRDRGTKNSRSLTPGILTNNSEHQTKTLQSTRRDSDKEFELLLQTNNIDGQMKDINIVQKLNEFYTRYPSGPVPLAEKIILRYRDIVANNQQMEIVYQDNLNDVVNRFNSQKVLYLEIGDYKKKFYTSDVEVNLDPLYFNDSNVARYSGQVQIKKDLLCNLNIGNMTKKVIDSCNKDGTSGMSPKYKKFMKHHNKGDAYGGIKLMETGSNRNIGTNENVENEDDNEEDLQSPEHLGSKADGLKSQESGDFENKVITHSSQKSFSKNMPRLSVVVQEFPEDYYRVETVNRLKAEYHYNLDAQEEKCQDFVHGFMHIELNLKMYCHKLFEITMQIRHNIKNICSVEFLRVFTTIITNSKILEFASGSNQQGILKNEPTEAMLKNDVADPYYKGQYSIIQFKASQEQKSMLSDEAIEDQMKSVINPEDAYLVKKGIRMDVVTRTYMKSDQIKKIIKRDSKKGYIHVIMSIYMEAYDHFREQMIQEFGLLNSFFKEIFKQQPDLSFNREPRRFEISESWKNTMTKQYDSIIAWEDGEEYDHEVVDLNSSIFRINLDGDKKHKNKFYNTANENYTKDYINDLIRTNLMNVRDQKGKVCFRKKDSKDKSEEKKFKSNVDNSDDVDDEKWIDYHRSKFWKNEDHNVVVKKEKHYDPYVSEFRSIITNSILVRDIETCMKLSIAKQFTGTKTDGSDTARAKSIKYDPNVRNFLMKTNPTQPRTTRDRSVRNPIFGSSSLGVPEVVADQSNQSKNLHVSFGVQQNAGANSERKANSAIRPNMKARENKNYHIKTNQAGIDTGNKFNSTADGPKFKELQQKKSKRDIKSNISNSTNNLAQISPTTLISNHNNYVLFLLQ